MMEMVGGIDLQELSFQVSYQIKVLILAVVIKQLGIMLLVDIVNQVRKFSLILKGLVIVENPSPGERPGQIHYHEPNNTKWYLDIEEKQFYNQKTGELAPNKIQKLLKDKNVINAINKGLKSLGEDKLK